MAVAEAQRMFVDAVASARTTLAIEGLGIAELPALVATSIAEGYKLPFVSVSLKGNRFTTIPPELVNSVMRILFLDNNRIAILPPLQPYASLQYLSLRGNRLAELPASITDLVNLQTLDLADNFLTALPSELGRLRNLRMLNVRGNLGLHRLPLEVAKQLAITVDMEHPVEFPLAIASAKDVLEYVCAIKARGFPIDLCNHWRKNDGLCAVCSTGTGTGNGADVKGKNCRCCGKWVCLRCTAPNKYLFPCFESA